MVALKTKQDIDGIRESGNILYEAMKAMRNAIAPGITTGEMDKIAHSTIIKKHGSPAFLGYYDYPASLCISVNEEVIHGIPGKRKLAPGDIVGLDLGVIYKGYYSDAAVTLPVGRVDEEDARLIKVTEECLKLAIKKAVAGNRIRDISEAVYTHAQEAGYDVVRDYCGHGVGFALHEDPQIYNYPHPGPNPKLKEGMVLAIEPMINQGTWRIRLMDDGWTVMTADGKKSAHFEHTVVVMEDRAEILTRW